MQGGWAAARNMLGAAGKSPWFSEAELFTRADMHFRKAVGMLSSANRARMERNPATLQTQSLETPRGSGGEPWCTRKGEMGG